MKTYKLVYFENAHDFPRVVDETLQEDLLVSLTPEEAVKLQVPEWADGWCLYSREEGNSWECEAETPGADDFLYGLMMSRVDRCEEPNEL